MHYNDYDHLYLKFRQFVSNNLLLLHLVYTFWLFTYKSLALALGIFPYNICVVHGLIVTNDAPIK